MSINQLLHNTVNKLDIHTKSTTCNELFLKVNEVDTINFHSLNTCGVEGTSIISDGKGNLEWSNSISAKQKDIYLNKTPIIVNFTDQFTEFSLPLHRDGSFFFKEESQIVHIHICLYYKYINSVSHLPFYIQVKKNDQEVYLNAFGDYDKIADLNKISDYLSLEATSTDVIKFYIKKKFNDVGDFEIQSLSYISYEVL